LTIANQSAVEGQAFSFSLANGTFTDVDGNTLKYSAKQVNGKALPKWLKLDDVNTGALSGTPADADSNVTLRVRLTATDTGRLSDYGDFDVAVEGVNVPPTLKLSPKPVVGTEGKLFSYSLPKGTFVDADKGDVLSYSVVSKPDWLTFDTSTLKLSGLPKYNAADGAVSVTFRATDSSGIPSTSDAVLSISFKNVPKIKGTAGANTIIAGSGDDTISGLLGNDDLTGGAGDDRFIFDTKLGANNIDIIRDFTSGSDKIQLSKKIFSALSTKALPTLTDSKILVAPNVSAGQTADHRIVFDSVTHQLYYDADGAGGAAAIQFATLVGVNTISVNDFTLA
jgi:Ca2+-binding RTX toxin-like protein